jgi:hypothetical protein
MGFRPIVSVDAEGEPTVGDYYTWMTWAETQSHIDRIGSAIMHENLAPVDPESGVRCAPAH